MSTALGTASAALGQTQTEDASAATEKPRSGRIRQSVMGWCFKPMPAAELAKAGKRLGLVAFTMKDSLWIVGW